MQPETAASLDSLDVPMLDSIAAELPHDDPAPESLAPFIQIRQAASRSWFDPAAAPMKARELWLRLAARCRGHRGLFLTLTYDPQLFPDPQDLYHRASEEQHVPLFLRKLERALGERDQYGRFITADYDGRGRALSGVSLSGRWFCKMEFQKNGNVHFHIILLDVDHADQGLLQDLWGRGHVWVRRLTPANMRYCCKYVGKDDSYPPFIYGERLRSVRLVRVSTGFWTGERRRSSEEAERDRDPLDDPRYCPIRYPSVLYRCGQTIDDALRRNAETVVIRERFPVAARKRAAQAIRAAADLYPDQDAETRRSIAQVVLAADRAAQGPDLIEASRSAAASRKARDEAEAIASSRRDPGPSLGTLCPFLSRRPRYVKVAASVASALFVFGTLPATAETPTNSHWKSVPGTFDHVRSTVEALSETSKAAGRLKAGLHSILTQQDDAPKGERKHEHPLQALMGYPRWWVDHVVWDAERHSFCPKAEMDRAMAELDALERTIADACGPMSDSEAWDSLEGRTA